MACALRLVMRFCLAGNFIADVMLQSCPSAECAIMNAGTLRADNVLPIGPLTMDDLGRLLPMVEEQCVIAITGSQLLLALENGVSQYPKSEGRFPLVSAIRFQFDGTAPAWQRVVPGSVYVCDQPLDTSRVYRMASKKYLTTGKDGYSVFANCPVVVDGEVRLSFGSSGYRLICSVIVML